jgi:predicted DNA-binding transcriptional regulator YafY
LLPPKVEPGVPEAVQRALLDRKRLRISYLRPSEDEARQFEVSVLGLVVRGSVTYLVTVFLGYSKPRILAMHRIKHAAATENPAVEPPGFSFADYVASGELDWPVGEPTRVSFEVTEDLARVLTETRAADDQHIGPPNRNGWCSVSCTLPNTVETRHWLLSLGPRCRRVRYLARQGRSR